MIELDGSGTRISSGEYRETAQALTGIEEVAVVSGIVWIAFQAVDRICNRGNTSASCEEGATTVSITCNRCEGTARCQKSNNADEEIVETANGDSSGAEGGSCQCWCA
jgi:hypothetical protein